MNVRDPSKVYLLYSFQVPVQHARVWAFLKGDEDAIHVTCTLDGKIITESATSLQGNNVWRRWSVCDANNLPLANHTIKLTVSGSPQPETFCFDQINVVPVTSTLSTNLEDNPSQSSIISSPSPTAQTGYSNMAGGHSVGAIVAGVLAGVLLVLVCGAIFLWRMRRRRAKYESTASDDIDGTCLAVLFEGGD